MDTVVQVMALADDLMTDDHTPEPVAALAAGILTWLLWFVGIEKQLVLRPLDWSSRRIPVPVLANSRPAGAAEHSDEPEDATTRRDRSAGPFRTSFFDLVSSGRSEDAGRLAATDVATVTAGQDRECRRRMQR